ncbi:MAG: DUF1684 domain-containing protein [bacterium]
MILIILSLFLIVGCNNSDVFENSIIENIQRYRAEKDRTFKTSVNSPIPETHKDDFQGLSYFPIDLNYRFYARLNQYENKTPFKMMTSTGVERKALKYGYFKFEMDGEECILQVYKVVDMNGKFSNSLFLPFLDATSGHETYPGGRYLDFRENASGLYEINFNLAYNPSCAYGKPEYSCPLPPQENRLDVAIRAGEKYSPY